MAKGVRGSGPTSGPSQTVSVVLSRVLVAEINEHIADFKKLASPKGADLIDRSAVVRHALKEWCKSCREGRGTLEIE